MKEAFTENASDVPLAALQRPGRKRIEKLRAQPEGLQCLQERPTRLPLATQHGGRQGQGARAAHKARLTVRNVLLLGAQPDEFLHSCLQTRAEASYGAASASRPVADPGVQRLATAQGPGALQDTGLRQECHGAERGRKTGSGLYFWRSPDGFRLQLARVHSELAFQAARAVQSQEAPESDKVPEKAPLVD